MDLTGTFSFWFLPASISAEAIRALGGTAQKTAAASVSEPEGRGS